MTRQFDLDTLQRRLAGGEARRVFRWVNARHAAVAIVLDPGGRVLLVQRAERRGDPWSAHVSLPGGMQHEDDGSLLRTCVRETREEVSVSLDEARLIGALDEVRAMTHGGLRPMSIAPFVFLLGEAPTTSPGPEVDTVFWLPLRRAAEGELDDRRPFKAFGLPLRLPCWRFEERCVWGLTYGILKSLLGFGRAG